VMVDFTQMKSFGQDPLILERGEGIRVTDVFGQTYIDGLSGVFTVNLGHGVQELIDVAAEQAPRVRFVQGEGTLLPFDDGSFNRIFTSHFYGHLEENERERFLQEARRVARELVIVDACRAHSSVAEEYQERILNDGSRWEVYKRFFSGVSLAEELGGGHVLHEGLWFVVVASP